MAGLPVAFKINSLKEVVAKMVLDGGGEGKKVTGTVESDGSTADVRVLEQRSSIPSCSCHPNQSLDLYCCKCEELFCLHCIAFDQKHVSHPYDKVSEEVTQDCHRKVREELASLLQEQQDIRRAVEDVRTTQEEIEASSAVISHKISKSYDSVIGIVEKKKESELCQFQSEIDAKLNEVETYKENLTSVLLEVNEVKRFVKDRVEGLGDVKFMACKKEIVLKIDQMLHRIRSLLMSPQKPGHIVEPLSELTGIDKSAGLRDVQCPCLSSSP